MFNDFVFVDLILFTGGLIGDAEDFSLFAVGFSSIGQGFMEVTGRLGCGAGGFFRTGPPCDIMDVELF